MGPAHGPTTRTVEELPTVHFCDLYLNGPCPVRMGRRRGPHRMHQKARSGGAFVTLIASESELIPGYRLIERLGQGGFAQVSKAQAPAPLLKPVNIIQAM